MALPAPIPPAGHGANEGAAIGLEVGSPAPDFELPTIDGGTVSAQELRGTDTALLFWNPGCSFCARMAGDLRARWQRRSPERRGSS